MEIRPFRKSDAPAVAELSSYCARGETDFVLNPYWLSEDELGAEFDRFGIDAERHLLVSDAGDGEVLGTVGFLRLPDRAEAGMCCPIVKRDMRGRGIGGELLRAARELGRQELGIRVATAGIGTRNRAGYSLLTSNPPGTRQLFPKSGAAFRPFPRLTFPAGERILLSVNHPKP